MGNGSNCRTVAIAVAFVAVLAGRLASPAFATEPEPTNAQLKSVELESSIQSLILELNSTDADVRAAAVKSLGNIRNTIGNATWPMVHLLADDDPEGCCG